MNYVKLAFQEMGMILLEFLSAKPCIVEREGEIEANIDVNLPAHTDEPSTLSIALFQMGMSKHLPATTISANAPTTA